MGVGDMHGVFTGHSGSDSGHCCGYAATSRDSCAYQRVGMALFHASSNDACGLAVAPLRIAICQWRLGPLPIARGPLACDQLPIAGWPASACWPVTSCPLLAGPLLPMACWPMTSCPLLAGLLLPVAWWPVAVDPLSIAHWLVSQCPRPVGPRLVAPCCSSWHAGPPHARRIPDSTCTCTQSIRQQRNPHA